MQNILVRSLSGSIYVALIILGCLGHTYGPSFLMLLLAGIAIYEWQSIRPKNYRLSTYLFSLLIFLLFAFTVSPLIEISTPNLILLKSILGLSIATYFLIQSFRQRSDSISSTSHNGFGLIYLFPTLLLLPIFPSVLGPSEPWLLLAVFILIWSSDTFAYLSGRFLGKNKLFERISPKKTWEGFIGGMVFTVLSSYLLEISIGILPLWAWMGLAILVAISGTLGDLFESAIKRYFKVKDSGSFIPGHGGILDRIDSLLFVLPLAYLYLSLISVFYL